MPLLSLDQLVSEETRESVMSSLLSIASSLKMKTTAWQDGQPIRTLLAVFATKFSDYTRARAQLARAGFLSFSSGDWMTFVCHHFYGVDRIAAQPATGYVTLTNAGAVPYTLAPGELVLAHAVSGATYRNAASVTIPAASSVASVPIQADVPGTDSDASPGAISVVVTTLLDVTVTNPLAVLGADEETDDALALRARQQQAATSPMGPKAVYAYVAKTPDYSPTSTPITRTGEDLDITTGTETVYLATAGGAPSSADVSIVQAAFDVWAEPQAFLAVAAAASELAINVTATVTFKSSLTVAQIKAAIQVALARYFKTIPIGGFAGFVRLDGLKSTIIGATPGFYSVAMSAPAADVAVTAGQVPVLGTVTLTVNLL